MRSMKVEMVTVSIEDRIYSSIHFAALLLVYGDLCLALVRSHFWTSVIDAWSVGL